MQKENLNPGKPYFQDPETLTDIVINHFWETNSKDLTLTEKRRSQSREKILINTRIKSISKRNSETWFWQKQTTLGSWEKKNWIQPNIHLRKRIRKRDSDKKAQTISLLRKQSERKLRERDVWYRFRFIPLQCWGIVLPGRQCWDSSEKVIA